MLAFLVIACCGLAVYGLFMTYTARSSIKNNHRLEQEIVRLIIEREKARELFKEVVESEKKTNNRMLN